MNISNEIIKNEGRDAGTSHPSENRKTHMQIIMKNLFVNDAITQPSGLIEIYVDDHYLILTPTQFLQLLWCGESVQQQPSVEPQRELGLLDMSRNNFLAKVKFGELAVHPVKPGIRTTVYCLSEIMAI